MENSLSRRLHYRSGYVTKASEKNGEKEEKASFSSSLEYYQKGMNMFPFLNGLTASDLLTLLADLFNFFLLIATIIAVTLTYRQIKESAKTQKATFSKSYI